MSSDYMPKEFIPLIENDLRGRKKVLEILIKALNPPSNDYIIKGYYKYEHEKERYEHEGIIRLDSINRLIGIIYEPFKKGNSTVRGDERGIFKETYWDAFTKDDEKREIVRLRDAEELRPDGTPYKKGCCRVIAGKFEPLCKYETVLFVKLPVFSEYPVYYSLVSVPRTTTFDNEYKGEWRIKRRMEGKTNNIITPSKEPLDLISYLSNIIPEKSASAAHQF
ncbi:hypothetical protein COZ55_01955 [archaeon CG_4_8_14_3_um_filter_38_5]|nr:MAG: hypothetical protein COS83_04635 [archaeon CG07_land_8_20_14_0_80_38_8]PIU88691.1 MAG: hypothetical protein COS64_02960 [archaeon CG06_land_8_20_14_3_00_37_11]PIX42607.1 MAG: hypothetical protein COZ55_01955 [archaeon CG_4_8_14_3_um_filter_38_5]